MTIVDDDDCRRRRLSTTTIFTSTTTIVYDDDDDEGGGFTNMNRVQTEKWTAFADGVAKQKNGRHQIESTT